MWTVIGYSMTFCTDEIAKNLNEIHIFYLLIIHCIYSNFATCCK